MKANHASGGFASLKPDQCGRQQVSGSNVFNWCGDQDLRRP